jgi:hypothetical protein
MMPVPMTVQHGERFVPARKHARWLWSLAVCAIGLVSGLALLHRASPRANPIPRELVYDFGTAKAGQPIEHAFTLRNTLAIQLNVDGVKSSCGCTVSRPPKQILSNSNAEIPVKVNLPDDDQKFESSVVINFKEIPPVKLIVRGQVIRRYPSLLNFGEVRRGEAVRREFRLRSDGTRAAKIGDLKFDTKLFKVAVQADPTNAQDLLCSVDLIDTTGIGDLNANIVVRLDDANGELVTIPCHGKVLQPVEIARSTIAVGAFAAGEFGSADIEIAAPYGDTLAIFGVAVSDPTAMRCDSAWAKKSDHGLILPVTVNSNFTGDVFKGIVDLTIVAGGVSHKRCVHVYAMKAAPVQNAPPQLVPTPKVGG